MRILKIRILLFTLIFSTGLSAQPFLQELDSTIKKKVPELGLQELTIHWSEYEGTILTDIQRFNKQGKRIEHLFYNGNQWTRHKEEFNQEGKRTAFIFFDARDTAQLTSKQVYTYIDSLNYKKESFGYGVDLSTTTTHQSKKVKDTLWVTEIETSVHSFRVNKTLSRYTQKGDSLLISEYVTFDDKGEKMKDIKSYYHLQRKQKNGDVVCTNGKYEVVVDESQRQDQDLYIDVIKYPEKYIQYQLDGKYPYTYGEEIQSKSVYNAAGKLLSSRDHAGNRKFYYNTHQQLERIEAFSEYKYTGEKEKLISKQAFTYDSRGLPVKVVETNIESGKTVVYTFDFK